MDLNFGKLFGCRRAGLTIGQTGQMPVTSRLNIKILLYWFFMFLGCSPRVKMSSFLMTACSI